MKQDPEMWPKIVVGNIRKIREFKNYTQDYLAMKLDISQNAYSKIELGYSKLTLGRLFQIAEVLEVDVVQLICFEHTDLVQMPTATELRERSAADYLVKIP
jgi:transcriptional regulator with XRE-family HTH domain